jgi:hypothetical protein
LALDLDLHARVDQPLHLDQRGDAEIVAEIGDRGGLIFGRSVMSVMNTCTFTTCSAGALRLEAALRVPLWNTRLQDSLFP